MEKYVLTQDLLTGNELIDSEHRKIFNEVNALLDACSRGKGRENLSSLGEFLVEYVTKHFSDEEDLQKQSKYPEYTEHHKFHEWYKQKLGDAIIKLEQEGPTINSRTRTRNDRTRICSVTITPYPKLKIELLLVELAA